MPNDKPERIPVLFENIPEEMQKKPNWMLWRWDLVKGKWTKPPYQANGHHASSTDPTTWVSFSEAKAAYDTGKWDGIGFGLSNGYAGLDWDDCRDPATGETRQQFTNYIRAFDSYTEISPSQTGFKTLISGQLPGKGHHKDGIGVFTNARYFCVTGHLLDGRDQIMPRQEQLDKLIRWKWPNDYADLRRPVELDYAEPDELFPEVIALDRMLQRAPQKAKDLFNGDWEEHYPPPDKSQSEADLALCDYLAYWLGKNAGVIHRAFKQSGLYREKWDRSDYRDRTLSIVLAPKAAPPPPPTDGLFVHNADILTNLRPIEWQIGGILVDKSFYYDFGDPGSFKTFVALDRLLCVAAGIDYHGHSVSQGTVFYVCGEGQQGIGRRIAAWHNSHGTKAADVPFFVTKVPTQLMDIGALEGVREAVDVLAGEYGDPAVLHIDTLSRNFGNGDESKTQDMNTVIQNLDAAFGNDFCRGLTHHTGHFNKERARGSIALHGAADSAFRMEYKEAINQVVVECKKMKDAKSADPMLFDLELVPVVVGSEAENNEIMDQSYVLNLADEGDQVRTIQADLNKLSEAQKDALGVLERLYVGLGNPELGVLESDWQNACIKDGIYARKSNFKRGIDSLAKRGLTLESGDGCSVYPVSKYLKPQDDMFKGDV